MLRTSASILAAAATLAAPAALEGSMATSRGKTTVRFAETTGGIASIVGVDGTEFVGGVPDRPLVWRLVFRDPSGKEISLDNSQAQPPIITHGAHAVTVRWSRVDLGGERGVLDVRVVADTRAEPVLLRLWVRNRSTSFGLWNVHFPVIAPISRAGTCDIAKGHGNWGELHRAARETLSGNYPCHNMPLQLMLVQQAGDGLYLAAHDAGAMPKDFHITPGGEFRVETWAAGMGVPGSDWSAPYPFALSVYRGDWVTGCKRYRDWALRSAPWTRKGPLANRTDVPDSIKNVCAWLQTSGASPEAVPPVREFARKVGAPVGTHWYNWHAIPFDTDYPGYFPTKPGFAEGVADLKRDGIVVMPYINARLWDIANKGFPEAEPHTARNEKGEVTIEEYGSGAKLAVMCPAQPFWQAKVGEIVRRLGEECGVNAVYLDQIASAPPRRCFDPKHGHSIGSGAWWVEGYGKMMAPIKQWCAERGIGLTTENDAEPYMDTIDGHLIWTPRDANEVPMMTAVYGGYSLYFGSNRAFGFGAESYCLCQARDFTWGAQLGWDGAALLEPAHAEELECIGRLARLRAVLRPYLVYGEMLEVLRPENDLPQITGKWNTWRGDQPVTLPAVHAALWKARDGSVAVIAANADTKPHRLVCTVDMDQHGVGKAIRWSVSRITAAGSAPMEAMSGRWLALAVDVPARDGVAVRLRAIAGRQRQ